MRTRKLKSEGSWGNWIRGSCQYYAFFIYLLVSLISLILAGNQSSDLILELGRPRSVEPGQCSITGFARRCSRWRSHWCTIWLGQFCLLFHLCEFPILLDFRSRANYYRTMRLADTFANSVHGPFEVLQSTHLDWLLCYPLGNIFYINGLRTV